MKYLNKIMIAGMMAILAVACASPEAATPGSMAYGDWEVVEFYVDGQSNGVTAIDRFTLDRNDTFVLEDANGILTSGAWSATENSLTLSGSNGVTFAFAIVFQSRTKMHLTQTISNPTVGSFTITYLLDRYDDGTNYGDGVLE
ncbi:MAG: hypothetical protein JXQ96_07700 [Cyclobacteriaceae bacterium]